MTLFTASRKSFSVTVFLRARIAYIPASVHTLLISAPRENKKYIGQKRKLIFHGKESKCLKVLTRNDISQNTEVLKRLMVRRNKLN